MACKNCSCKSPKLEIVPMDHMFRLPERAYSTDAGFDVYSAEDVILYPFRVVKIKTGLTFNIPEGYEIQVRSRSGLASKGIIVANAPGTVDSSYTGETCVLLLNVNDGFPRNFEVKRGDRIAQFVFAKVQEYELVVASELKESERGAAGFGSSGLR